MAHPLHVAMLAIHSSPLGPLGTRDTGGMSVYVRETAKWLARQGHRVDIFTCAGRHPSLSYLWSDVRLIHLGGERFAHVAKSSLPLYLDEIFDCLDQFKKAHALSYDLVHSHYWLSGVVGARASERWSCPHVTMFHTLGAAKNQASEDENEPRRRVASERQLAASVDALVVPAEREKRHLLEYYRADSNKIHVVPCGVNLAHFQPLDRKASRDRLKLNRRRDILLYVGRMTPVKGIDILLAALARLKDVLPEIHLMVVGGDGPRAPSTRTIQQQIMEAEIGEQVSLAGRIDPSWLPHYYSAADLLVLPSRYESFGLVVLEALACGTPVLSTPVGAMESIIEHGVNGAIVEGHQVDAVAQGIVDFLNIPHHRRTTADAIRATVLGFDWKAVAQSLERVYSHIINHKTM